MSELAHTDEVVTKSYLSDFYQQILPYLGGAVPAYVNMFRKSDIYDGTEKVIGGWFGKPLYQKTISATMPDGTNQGYKEIETTVTDLDIMVDIHCVSYDATNNIMVPSATYGSSQYERGISYSRASEKIALYAGTNRSSETAYITMRYTKTSDAADSFNNIDANSYSTDERVVGTWIDGKPIYQKTYTGTTPSTVSSIGDPLNVPMGTSIERVIDAKVVFFNSNGTHYVGTLMTVVGMDKGVRFNFESNLNPSIPNVYTIYCTQESWCNLPYYLTVFYTKTTD